MHNIDNPKRLAKIQERNGWTSNDMDLIYWTALGQASLQMPIRMTQVVKVSYDLLPMLGVMVHGYEPKPPTPCMLCHHDMKNRDHILQSPHHTNTCGITVCLLLFTKPETNSDIN
jgi:hypothetical protein